jgi:hypothetical protein
MVKHLVPVEHIQIVKLRGGHSQCDTVPQFPRQAPGQKVRYKRLCIAVHIAQNCGRYDTEGRVQVSHPIDCLHMAKEHFELKPLENDPKHRITAIVQDAHNRWCSLRRHGDTSDPPLKARRVHPLKRVNDWKVGMPNSITGVSRPPRCKTADTYCT